VILIDFSGRVRNVHGQRFIKITPTVDATVSPWLVAIKRTVRTVEGSDPIQDDFQYTRAV
jgi:hypothetical protein